MPRPASDHEAIEAEIDRVRSLGLDELRTLWRVTFRSSPPGTWIRTQYCNLELSHASGEIYSTERHGIPAPGGQFPATPDIGSTGCFSRTESLAVPGRSAWAGEFHCRSTNAMRSTPLQARTRLPSCVAIILRTTLPPEGISQV